MPTPLRTSLARSCEKVELFYKMLLSEMCLHAAHSAPQLPLFGCVHRARAFSVSIIRQLCHSKGRDIIVCFLFHSAQPSVKCESIHCCLGYIFLLAFCVSINKTEGYECRGSPRCYESVGPQCEASSSKHKWWIKN